MFKILIINKYGHHMIKQSNIIPRVGDSLDLFYEPLPKVTAVVLFPSDERINAMTKLDVHIDNFDAIITCE